jgi:hypothetical protein
MEDLTEDERVVLRDVLDIAIDEFEDAMHRDTEQAPKVDQPQSIEELLDRAGSFGELLTTIRNIRKKV